MGLSEDFKASAEAYRYLMEHTKRSLEDVSKAYQGANHRQNKQAAEIEDLWKAVEELRAKHEALINRLKEKFAKGEKS